jgi:hypothetical protein
MKLSNVYLKLLFLMSMVFLLASTVSAQHLPYIRGAAIQPKITFDSKTGIFTYSYEITNSPSSVGNIVAFYCELYLPPGTQDPGTQGLKNNPEADFSTRILPRGLKTFEKQVVPTAFIYTPDGPRGWDGKLAVTTFGSFGGPNPSIHPGQTLGPFIIQSRGLAGIRNFVFEPNELSIQNRYLPPAWPPLPSAQIDKIYAKYSEIIHSVRFYTKAPAPYALPKNCDPVCMVQFLMNEKEQAYKLGWITNAGVANSLDAKLKEAEKKLKEGQTQSAINILKSFILDLEAQHQGQTGQGQGANTGNAQTSGKHVTDNAYYLLKPNAEFILYKLGVTSFP